MSKVGPESPWKNIGKPTDGIRRGSQRVKLEEDRIDAHTAAAMLGGKGLTAPKGVSKKVKLDTL